MLRQVARFILVFVVAAALISLAGRMFSDFDTTPEKMDLRDILRGFGAWAAAVLIAVLDLLRSRRRNRWPGK